MNQILFISHDEGEFNFKMREICDSKCSVNSESGGEHQSGSNTVIKTRCFYNINVDRKGLMAWGRKAITLVKQTKLLRMVNTRIFKIRFEPKSSMSSSVKPTTSSTVLKTDNHTSVTVDFSPLNTMKRSHLLLMVGRKVTPLTMTMGL